VSVLGRIYSHSNLAGTTLPCNTCCSRVPQNLSRSLCKWSSSSSSIQGMEGSVLLLSTLARRRGRSSCPCRCPPVCCTMAPERATSDGQAVQMRPDGFGRFGKYGGKYVPETLMHALSELESAFYMLLKDRGFQVPLNLCLFACFFVWLSVITGSSPLKSLRIYIIYDKRVHSQV
jgi:hypothetical protein